MLYFFFGAAFFEAFNAILRGGTGKSTTLTRRSLSLRDQHIAITRARYCALDHDEVVLKIDAANAQVANRDLRVAHVARHTLTGEYARRERRCTDRTLHLEHVTVRLGTAAEAVATNDARKTAALGGSDHINELLVGEDVDQNAVASLHCNLFAIGS